MSYRALIVDQEMFAAKLSQFLLRTDLSNKIIQTVTCAYSLQDAYIHAETHEFIYIDPLAFGLNESMHFITEVLSRSAVKAITLFRSGRQWQDRQRDVEALLFAPPNLRMMQVLDKDLMGDTVVFAQLVRNNISSMESMLLQARQHAGLGPDPGRSGVWNTGELYGGALPRPMPDYVGSPLGAQSYGGVPGMQLSEIINAVIGAIARQPYTPTMPLLPAPSDAAQLQAAIPQIQQALAALQTELGKVRDQANIGQRDLRESSRTLSNVEQRVQEIESRQTRGDQRAVRHEQRLGGHRLWLTLLSVTSGVLLVAVIALAVALARATGH